MKRKLQLFAIFPLLAVAVACRPATHEQARQNLPVVRVSVTRVASQQWPRSYSATGTVEARETASVAPKVMAVIQDITVDVGDRVRAGQLLARLDARDLEAAYRRAQAGLAEAKAALEEANHALAAAEAQRQLAEATFRRMQSLYEKKSISDQEFDEAQARFRSAQASYDMAVAKRRQVEDKIRQAEEAFQAATVMLSYAQLHSPFDGVVVRRHHDPGDLATPGVPLLTLEKGSGYRLELAVEESLLEQIRTGIPVTVELPALGQTLQARITEIVPAVDPASRAFAVRIALPQLAGLRSGLFARAEIPLGSRKVLAVPLAAIEQSGQIRAVYVVEQGRARRRLVTTGEQRGSFVEILSGLREGDQLVAQILPRLADGSPVEVQP